MWSPREVNFSIMLVVLATIVSATRPERSQGGRPCPLAYKCSSDEDIVWATDGRVCTVWRNACQLANENCQRQNRYIEVLKNVSKDECQKLCSDICTANYDPVCAEYKGVERTFSNSCMLTNHICRSGETYSLHRAGNCKQEE